MEIDTDDIDTTEKHEEATEAEDNTISETIEQPVPVVRSSVRDRKPPDRLGVYPIYTSQVQQTDTCHRDSKLRALEILMNSDIIIIILNIVLLCLFRL